MKILLGYQTTNTTRSKGTSGQHLVNLYAEMNPEGAEYPFNIYGTPGYIQWADMESTKAIQGMQVMGGLLYVVTGNTVYKVTTAGVKTSLGTLTGSEGRVDMCNNGTQMFIKTPDGEAWFATSAALTKVVDADYPSASSATFLDGFFIVSKTSSGQFNISASYDASAWDALDFATAEETPDNLVRVFAFNGALWLFGETSYEVYYNSGNADFPFDQIQGAVNTTRGCAAAFSVVQEDNSMFFLGNDRIVYRVEGYNPVRISTHAMETIFNDMTTISDAFGFVHELDGHKFYILTFPSESETWAYDISNGLWAKRTTLYGFQPRQWSANAHAVFAGKQLVGHNLNGKIYELSPVTYTEAGTAIERIVQGSVQWFEGQRVTYDNVRLDMDEGVGLITGQGSDPQVMMRYSDDGGNTWSNENWRGFGKIGEYRKRAVWRRLGSAGERIFEFKVTDPVPVRITGCYADGRIGRT